MSLRSQLARPFPWFAALASLALLYLLALCLWGMTYHRFIPIERGWSWSPHNGNWVVDYLNPTGPAANKLRPGDQILRLNGSIRAVRLGLLPLTFQPNSTYSVEVLRQGRKITQTLIYQPRPFWLYFSYFLLALLNFGIAVFIATSRPDYAVAQIAFFFFVGSARAFSAASLKGFIPPLADFSLWFALLSSSFVWEPIQWAVVYDFALRFPEPVQQPRFLRLLRGLLYSAAAGVFCLSLFLVIPYPLGLPDRGALLPQWISAAWLDAHLRTFADVIGATALLCAPFILARNYRKLPDPVARRRVRWAALGIGIELVPISLGIAIIAVFRALGFYSAYEAVESFLDHFAAVFSSIGPLALAYAIAKHRVLGIRVVIRKGLQYLLARNVLRLLFWLPLIAIAADLLTHRQPLAGFFLTRSWWFYLFLLASVSVTLRYRVRLQLWVDRKFFRSAYEEEIVLSELIDALQSCDTSDEVARLVSAQLEQSLHPSAIAVLYRRGPAGLFTVGYPRDAPLGLEFRGILNERVQDALQSHRSATTFTEIAGLLYEKATQSDEGILKTLLTAISGSNGQLVGVLLLGEKKSEQSYSARDRRLLQAIVVQMGIIFEVLSLREQVREEGRVRLEVLGKLDRDHIQLVLECPHCGICYSQPATHCEADGGALGLTLPIERIVDGKYRLERRIGTGGMGAVYEASDLRLNRAVALKVMTAASFGNIAALRRFEREARAAARLQHPNIVAIYDFGTLRGGGAYLVMQRIIGRSWRSELIRASRIHPQRAAPLFDQLCDAVACAHARGVVHRDLKPENLLLSFSSDGAERVTVLDFGVAKLGLPEDELEPQLTSVDRVVGTHGYMSPEQRSGQLVDARSDIYAVAVITVESLTNYRPPHAGASRDWLKQSLQWPEPDAHSAALLDLLEKALHDSASDRIPAIHVFQQELIPLLSKCPPPFYTPVISRAGSQTETMPL